MKTNSAIITFYASLALVMAMAITYTLYQGSLFLFKTRQVAQLERQHQALSVRRQELQASLAEQTALATFDSSATSGYQSIAKPIIVTVNSTVALR